jgi:hypothetical protein
LRDMESLNVFTSALKELTRSVPHEYYFLEADLMRSWRPGLQFLVCPSSVIDLHTKG